ncbi:MAG: aspartate aminotransferase family protein [Gemmatimonadetes bacterium]|nr:aspartate aminotransferase family protein [Gemmatimonadota bacterium]
MKPPRERQSPAEVLARLRSKRANDVDWSEGKTFAYVFAPDREARELVEAASRMFLWENALDPTVCPSLVEMESEIIAMAAGHLGGDENTVGNFTSGGTESVLLSVKTARDWARANRPEIEAPELVLPITAHACFHKGCEYFGIKPVVVPVDPLSCRVDPEVMRRAITPSTILLVASAPSYAHGVLDPIREIGAIAQEADLLFHVDGCIGAFLMPFLRKLGAAIPDFDLGVPGVSSISMDLHKYGFAPKGASVILYRDKSLRRHQIFSCSGWTGYAVVNPTIQSSRSGGPVAAAWTLLQHFGEEGYLEIARALKRSTDEIIAGVENLEDIHLIGEPSMSIVAFGSDSVNLFRLADELKRNGWHVQPQLRFGDVPESIHLTIVPVTLRTTGAFLHDLEEALHTMRATKAPPNPLLDTLKGVDLASLTPDAIEALLGAAGLGGGKLPGDMAEINEILNILPIEARDALLTAFFNEIGIRHR